MRSNPATPQPPRWADRAPRTPSSNGVHRGQRQTLSSPEASAHLRYGGRPELLKGDRAWPNRSSRLLASRHEFRYAAMLLTVAMPEARCDPPGHASAAGTRFKGYRASPTSRNGLRRSTITRLPSRTTDFEINQIVGQPTEAESIASVGARIYPAGSSRADGCTGTWPAVPATGPPNGAPGEEPARHTCKGWTPNRGVARNGEE